MAAPKLHSYEYVTFCEEAVLTGKDLVRSTSLSSALVLQLEHNWGATGAPAAE